MRVDSIGAVPSFAGARPVVGARTQSPPDPRDSFAFSPSAVSPGASSPAPQKSGTTQPPNTRQLADSYGRVTHLALMLSSYVGGEAREQVLNAYKTLFTEMEPDTKFTIVVEDDGDRSDVEQVMRDNNVANPERIRFVRPDVGGLTVWARDMMVGLYTPEDADHTALLHQSTLHSWHDNDAKVPGILTELTPSILLDTDLRVVTDGGDVQSNTKESFVGYYSIAATEEQIGKRMESDPALKKKLMDEYQRRFGKQVVDQRGPLEHPFKMVPRDTHGGHRTPFRLVHDPAFRADDPGPGKVTLQQATEDMAVALFADHFGKPVQVMGRDNPATEHVEEPATDHMDMGLTPIDDNTFLVGDPGLAMKLLGETRFNGDNQDDFDEYARILEQKGYNVIRVPHLEPSDSGGPYVSYNNCLMERFEKDGREVRRVFLPVYGMPKLDDYAIDVWRSQGYEVHPIRLDALSERWGALRCISNWLDRSPRG